MFTSTQSNTMEGGVSYPKLLLPMVSATDAGGSNPPTKVMQAA